MIARGTLTLARHPPGGDPRGLRAVLLDAMGTLVELLPPAPRLVAALERRGVAVSEAEAWTALRAEIAHYRAHHDEAGDRRALARLRAECTEVLRAALPPAARDVDDLQDALLGSLSFAPYPEVPGALAALRADGVRLVVVSNWDVSLRDVLAETGLDALVDDVVISAEAGAAKPDPEIFAVALGDVAPEAALHVGDSVDADVAGARGAGIEPVLVARDGGDAPVGVRTVRSLRDLPQIARHYLSVEP